MKTVDVAWPARMVANESCNNRLRPTDRLHHYQATPQISEGEITETDRTSTMLQNLTFLSVEWSVWHIWKGGCDEQKEMCGCRDGMSPRRRRRLHFSRLPACDPTSSQCLVSIHRLLNYFRLTLPPLQSSLFASLLTWLQSSESE